MSKPIHIYPEAILYGPDLVHRAHSGVVVENGVIQEIQDSGVLRQRDAYADVIELPGQLLMAGFVNAHQHGRGLTQFQLGFPDDVLETWFASHRRSGIFDPYGMTLLASLEMIACGVTGTIHANTAYGSGNYAAEIERTFEGYEASGIRATVGVGLMDRAGVVYPAEMEPAFIDALPPALRQRMRERSPQLHFADAAEAKTAVGELRARFEGSGSRLRVAYAPAGPQWVSDELMAGALRQAAEIGAVVHIHALESWAQMTVVRHACPDGLLAHLANLGPVDERLSFGHAVWLGPDDADMAARCGMTFVRNAGSNLRLKAGIAPLAEYARRGVRVAIGTDNLALSDDEDILKELRLAGRLARSPHWDGPPAPTGRDMLLKLTRHGAVAGGFGESAGLLIEGAPADLVALDLKRPRGAYLDPEVSLPDLVYHRADARDVRLTMVAGEVLYRDGRFVRHDLSKVAADVADDVARAMAQVSDADRRDVEELVRRIGEHYAGLDGKLHQGEFRWTALTERSWA